MICPLCYKPIGLLHNCTPVVKTTETLVERARRALMKHEAGYDLIVDEDLVLAALQTYIKVHA
jgi:hypothetical protein